MRTAARRTSALVGALFVIGSLGSSAYAGGGGYHDDGDKIVVCHKTSSHENRWVKIEIPEKAFYKGHKQHGDFKVTKHHKCPPKYDHW